MKNVLVLKYVINKSMHDIEELIEYYPEGEFLDFKREEYNEQSKPHLIKDILAFSNANVKGDKYIIIGVHKKDGGINLFNIDSKFDSANIQQYVHANITPELDIEYFPYAYKGHKLMVLKIKNPIQQPYMTLKNVTYSNGTICLKSNECWIRKGSYQLTATRKDIDQMYAIKANQEGFKGNIVITFTETETDVLELESLKGLELPSDKNAKELETIIKHKEQLKQNNPISYQLSIRQPMMPWQGTTYEERDLETLKRNLENVKNTYHDEDLFYLYEKQSYKLNLNIVNVGDIYLEDASIEVSIPRIKRISIAKKIYSITKSYSNPLIPYAPRIPNYDELNYPTIKEVDDYFIIAENIGNLKHNIKQLVFKVPIRLAVGAVVNGTEIILQCKIFGKNLKNSIERRIKIIIK